MKITKFFFKFKKNLLLVHFPNFWKKNQKIGFQAQNHRGLQHHVQIQRNLIIQFHENTQRDAGGKEGQTLFHGILSATAGGLASTTALDWHLKQACRVRCLSNQKSLHHSQHTKNQLNSYTNELNGHAYF